MKKIIGRFQGRIFKMVSEYRPRSIIDLGCGEGFIVETLKPMGEFQYLGIDKNLTALALARQNHKEYRFIQGDILQIQPPVKTYDLAICLEVLEHLEEPQRAVEQIRLHTSSAAIISVPWEPYFRVGNFIRGKYWATLGNHPEHVQHFSPKSFNDLLNPFFDNVQIITCFPWLIAFAHKRA